MATGALDGMKLEAHGHFVPAGIVIPTEPLLRMQGYRDLTRVRDRVRKIADEAAAQAQNLIVPEAHYRRVHIKACTANSLRLETGTVFHSNGFAKAVGGCAEAVIFLLTVGPGLDEAVAKQSADGDLVTALFLEMAGWLAVERATKQLAEHLWSLAGAEGKRLSRRLAPGYADWPLEEQKHLFDVFAGIDIPIQLLESSAMMPKKSRSGLYGLGAVAAKG
jgi:Vitamin B12 dependent methionine synthase, activation domain